MIFRKRHGGTQTFWKSKFWGKMQKIFFALRAISYEGTQTCDRFTKNVESAARFTQDVDVDVDVERRVVVPRPLLVSGSPFLPPLSKRVSLLKIRFSRPPAETKKKPCFYFIFILFFWGFSRFQREIFRKLEVLRFSETATEVHKLLEVENWKQNTKNVLRASKFSFCLLACSS